MNDESSPIAVAALLTILTGSIVFTFGSLHARAGRARNDLRDTKAKVPELRAAFRGLLWRAVKVGFWVILGVLILVAVAVRDTPEVPR